MNKQTEKLKSFFEGSKQFAGMSIQGYFSLPLDIFLLAYDHYLKTGENVIDEYARIQQFWLDYIESEPSMPGLSRNFWYDKIKLEKDLNLFDNIGFWNINAFLSKNDQKIIKHEILSQLQYIEDRRKKIEESDYRNTHEYKTWRTKVFQRDNYICQECNKRGGNLEAHHICPFKDYPKKRYVVSNGVTLCKTCHKKKHRTTYAIS